MLKLKSLPLLLTAVIGAQAMAEPVLYTNDFESIIGEQFKKDTGQEIKVVKMSGGNLLARIAAERSNPKWDLIMFNGDNALYALDQAGDLKALDTIKNRDNLTDEARALVPANLSYFPVSIGSACVIVKRKDVDVSIESYEDLAQPALKDKVGMADPSVAAPAYPCIAGLFHQMGDAQAKAFFSQSFENGLRIFRTNGPTARALQSGEIDVALLTSQKAYSFLNQGADFEVIWPQQGAPATVRAVGVQKQTQYPETTNAFIDWMLSGKGQQFLADNGGSDGIFRPTVKQAHEVPYGPGADVKYNFTPVSYAYEHDAELKDWFADHAVN